MYDTILCAHDLGEGSRAALRAALDLARARKSTVHVLHVVMEPFSVPPGTWFAAQDSDGNSLAQRIQLAVTQELEAEIRTMGGEDDPPILSHVRIGDAAETIVAAAKELDAGVIVVGTHGRKGWQHLVLGSVAERIVRTSQVPVLTVSPNAAADWKGFGKRLAYNSILCPHDLSADSAPALGAALALGRELGATVEVLHVVADPAAIPPSLWFAIPEENLEGFQQRIRLAAARELERAIGEARRQGDPEARVHVWLGEPHHEIVAAANDLGACLIVMGAHGRKSWQHLMIGSVAERVIRTATVPVLTILPDAVSTWVRSREQTVGART